MRALLSLLVGGAVLMACKGGGGGGAPPVAALAGVWTGQSVELDAPPVGSGVGASVSLVLDGAGNITSISFDGQPGGTGTVTAVPNEPGIFSYVLSSGGEGGFFVNSTNQYAAVLDVDGSIAVLQRGAGALPAYQLEDVVGTWGGRSIFVDPGLEYAGAAPSQVTVSSNGTFSGSEEGQSFASTETLDFYVNTVDPTQAYWFARFASGATPDGIGRFVLSANKQFLAGFAGPNNGTFPADFSFPVWSKL